MLEIRPPNVTSSTTLQKNESVYNVELDLMEENFGENSCSWVSKTRNEATFDALTSTSGIFNNINKLEKIKTTRS